MSVTTSFEEQFTKKNFSPSIMTEPSGLCKKRKLEAEDVPKEADETDDLAEPRKMSRKATSFTIKSILGIADDNKDDVRGQLELTCELENKLLWRRFNNLGTEMIITKSGRRMFPTLRVVFRGLDPKQQYHVGLEIQPTDSKRYRYAYHRSCWVVSGKGDAAPPRRLFVHGDGPFSGELLENQPISFEKVKLTNITADSTSSIKLHSMNKYRPCIYLMPDTFHVDASCHVTSEMSDLLEQDDVKKFYISETEFIAVTAYQNQLITKLKIDSNPFAKGFRDSCRLSDIDRSSLQHRTSEINCPTAQHNCRTDVTAAGQSSPINRKDHNDPAQFTSNPSQSPLLQTALCAAYTQATRTAAAVQQTSPFHLLTTLSPTSALRTNSSSTSLQSIVGLAVPHHSLQSVYPNFPSVPSIHSLSQLWKEF